MKALSKYPGYFITDDGRVFSKRTQAGKIGEGLKELKPDINRGYRRVTMSINGKQYRKSVHRLMAYTFLGMPDPENHLVRHLDGDPTNNKTENLSWGTYKENEADKIGHKTKPVGEKHGRSKLKNNEVKEIKKMIRGGCRNVDIAKAFSVSPSTVKQIKAGTIWGYVN